MSISPRLKRLVVYPTAFFKLCFKNASLAVGEIDSVLEGFSHVEIIPSIILHYKLYNMLRKNLKPLKRVKGLYPTAKVRWFYALAL